MSETAAAAGFWPAQFLAAPGIPLPSSKEDVRAVIEVMVRKQGRRSNPVVVGDLVSMAEAVAGELMKRLERGEVPEELARAHLLKLNLSYVHVRLMSHADVEAKAAELRRSVDAVPRSSLVVYVGDLRWAVEEDRGMGETGASYSPVEHMVVELGRLLGELRADAAATGRGRVWLVATASYQTYMRCQQRRTTSLEAMWGLQAVVVPTGSTTGLALNLHASSPSSATPSNYRMAKLAQSPSKHAEPMAMAACREDHEAKLVLCTECSKNYESEASAVKKAEAEATCISNLPAWLLPEKPETPHKDKYLIDLKRKWSRLCQRLHFHSNHTNPSFAPYFGSSLHASSDPWWSSCLANSQCKRSIGGFLSFESLMEHGKSKNQWSPPPPPPHVSLSSPGEPASQDVTTTLVLGRFLVSVNDSATSEGFSPNSNGSANVTEELEQRLNENIPWQSNAVRAIAEAVTACRSDEKEKKGVWLFMKGNDHVAVRRAAIVIAEIRCGSANKMICVDPKRFRSREGFCSDVFAKASKIGSKKLVLLVEDIEQAPQDVVDALAAAVKNGFLKDQFAQELDLSNSIIIFTTSNFAKNIINVINLRLYSDELPSDDLKRKVKIELSRECKRMRDGIGCASLDLNLCTVEEDKNEDDDDDDAIPSDITHEGSNGEPGEIHNLISFIATRVIAFDGDHREAASTIRSRLARAVMNQGLRIDEEVVGMLAVASGWFLEKVWERWVAEVFEPAAALAATVKNGGKVVRVGLGEMGFVGGEEDDSEAMAQIGFMGSVLPRRIHVD